MAITRITNKRRARRFIAYDMEWNPHNYKTRLVGAYSGDEYREYKDVRTFLDDQLTTANAGKWFYAHAGGLADIQFVFAELWNDKRYRIDAAFSGSSAIIVHIRRNKRVWHFIDSYWLLREKLSTIGKSIGMEKTGPTDKMTEEEIKEWYATVPLRILSPYLENDCRILWHAIDQFESAIMDLGGQLQMTIASTALYLFRRKYLTRDIATNHDINTIARLAYFGSRVEVFNSHCIDSFYYDINSSFPFAMTKSVPGNFVKTHMGLPDSLVNSGEPYLCEVEIESPDIYLPPIPIRADDRVFFPSGSWRCWLTNIDLELLLQTGGKITHAYQTKQFDKLDDLGEYAYDMFDRRKATTDNFERSVYKMMGNSCYGKFAENREKLSMHINPSADVLDRINLEWRWKRYNAMIDHDPGWEDIPPYDPSKMLKPGIWFDSKEAKVAHEHVPIAAHITAQARRTLYEYLEKSDEIHYCDTDGFSTVDTYETGKELGDLKLEKKIPEGWFIAPKIYKLNAEVLGDDGEWEEKTITKAKGFTLRKRTDPKTGGVITPEQQWDSLIAGNELAVERMARVRENMRNATKRGSIAPYETTITKGLRDMIPKRFMFENGTTRPWTMGEINKFKKNEDA